MAGLAGFRVNLLGYGWISFLYLFPINSCGLLDRIHAVTAPRFPSKLPVYSFVASTLVLEMYFLQWFM